MITDDQVEIGWPHAALPNPKITDKRQASQPAQDEALRSIVEAVGGNRDTIYLASVDERWKAKQDHVDPLGAEQVSPPSPFFLSFLFNTNTCRQVLGNREPRAPKKALRKLRCSRISFLFPFYSFFRPLLKSDAFFLFYPILCQVIHSSYHIYLFLSKELFLV